MALNDAMDVANIIASDDPSLAYQLEVRLHYLYDVSEKWRMAIQPIGIDGEWMQHSDLPGASQTRACHSRGKLDLDSSDLFSSDDGGSEDEVESIADEDDNVDDLIENLPAEDAGEPPEGNWNTYKGMPWIARDRSV